MAPTSPQSDHLGPTEVQLRRIADTIPAYVAYLDTSLRYRVANRIYEQQFNHTGGEILGRTVRDLLQGSYSGVQSHLEEALTGIPQRFEAIIRTAAGDRVLAVVHTPDLNPAGQVQGIIVYGLDVTDQRQIEQELRVSHESLQLALSAANGIGTWDWDIATDLVRADATFAELYGVDPAEAAHGIPILHFTRNIHPDDVDRIQAAITQAIRTGDEYLAEYRLLQADQSVCWVAARGRCTYLPDGTPSHFPGVVIDITDRKRNEDTLRQTEKLAAVGRLASSIAHEINNPLESVTNLLYLIETTVLDDPAQAATYARLAQHELARVSQITTQTLRFFKQSTAPARISLAELSASVLSLYQGRLLNSGITVGHHILYNATILCFEGEIRQVLNNLVANAIDAMREGGRLLLRARPAVHPATGATGVRLTIADTGQGMSPKTLQHLFEPFFTTKGILGTGLGLWVSSELVAKHHGHLRVRSSQASNHRGTVFVLFLPDVPPSQGPGQTSNQTSARTSTQPPSRPSSQVPVPAPSHAAAPAESFPIAASASTPSQPPRTGPKA